MKKTFVSYVEGDEFGDVVEELEAMGGDPSFLDETEIPLLPVSIDETANDANFSKEELWNGEVDEDAYFDS